MPSGRVTRTEPCSATAAGVALSDSHGDTPDSRYTTAGWVPVGNAARLAAAEAAYRSAPEMRATVGAATARMPAAVLPAAAAGAACAVSAGTANRAITAAEVASVRRSRKVHLPDVVGGWCPSRGHC